MTDVMGTRHDGRVYDWRRHSGGDVPSPATVAAWVALDMLAPEQLPLLASMWLVHGHDGPAVAELAGLSDRPTGRLCQPCQERQSAA